MTKTARIYISSVILAGLTLFGYAIENWHTEHAARFVLYLAITMLGSGLKVSLPNVTGTMSVYFLFTLIGVVQLTLPETIVLGCGAALVQCTWKAHSTPKPLHILFNLASVAVATGMAYATYHWSYWQGLALSTPMMLGASAIVFFVANTGLVATVISLTEQKPVHSVWRDCYFWAFPYYLLGASMAGIYNAMSSYFGWEMALLTVPVIVFVYRSYRLYLDKLKVEKVHAQKVAALHLRTIEALALAIEAKDHTTHRHLERVKVYALAVGEELGLSEEEMQALEAAALLHDVGKLAVPEHIISKPGKLTPEEFEKMKIHPVVGAEILERVKFPYPVAPIVVAHHEKWDGNGYPYGLKGEEIPIGARILSAVDCLDALASDRQYRPALPLDEAMAELSRLSGKAFDPKVIEVLQRRYHELEERARKSSEAGDGARLSTDLKISRGKEPAAGFEESSPSARPSGDFLASIAAARQEAQELFELAKDLGNSLSLNETLWVISARVRRMVPYDAIVIALVRDQKLAPEFTAGQHASILQTIEVPLGEGLSGWVALNRRPILNGNPSLDPGYAVATGQTTKLESALSVPLEGVDKVIGVLTLYRTGQSAFSRDQLRVLLAANSKIAASIENALTYEQAKTSATVDFLTGLPNARSLFLQLDGEVSRSSREEKPLAVVVCDLDGFKQVNDQFGHLVGNDLLKVVATILRQSCRNYDYVARMGGDEFVIVMPRIEEAVIEQRIVELDQLVIEAGERLCGERVVSISAGYAVLGRDAEDAEGLLAEADRRMYRSKQSRKEIRPHSLEVS